MNQLSMKSINGTIDNKWLTDQWIVESMNDLMN